ncbi:MAG: helix-turn-helix domain-containing protein [Actinobacteria bacterium]|nr:helix-turn-helix domain-containing protein [Actinomycetota bacterium]
MDEKLLRVDDVQAILGIGRTKVYAMIRQGELPVLRVGRLVRIRRSDFEAWVAGRVEPPPRVA